MKFNPDLRVFGNTSYRGNCPIEAEDQAAFFEWVRLSHPGIGALAFHPRNEGARSMAQFISHQNQGLTVAVPDIVIPVRYPFLCEMKRRDHTKSRWSPGQEQYLLSANSKGAFACVALGFDATVEAFRCWLLDSMHPSKRSISGKLITPNSGGCNVPKN